MQVIWGPAKKIQICDTCGATLVYSVHDVEQGRYICCPNCHTRLESLFNLTWEGKSNGSENSKQE